MEAMTEAMQEARRLLGEILDMDADALPQDASMDTVPQWDSLNHIRLVSRLEEELGRPVDGEEILSITNLPNLAAMLNVRTTCA
jgi:acyl carrier protein